jgi:hypothetical protein
MEGVSKSIKEVAGRAFRGDFGLRGFNHDVAYAF